ncbi:GNAT domain [Macleaya cordata]|uniref:GNAT domain n=1 Tax=Macleaya cordata TaxID=56857 RepID=A0A200QD68_MACCD|nr:GNAT domain [Macleaya cordata]
MNCDMIYRKFNPPSSLPKKNEEFSSEHQKQIIHQCHALMSSDYRMNRLEFGEFEVREAVIDAEYWTAAWLRAEGNWEDRPHERHVDSYKRKYAEQEFNALKRRCKEQSIQKCICIIAVKKAEENVKHTTLKSVAGTLDLSIHHLLHGEAYPGEVVKARIFSTFNRQDQQRYGYISNLYVAKFARRQGIASNILRFSIESAKSNGVKQVFVHVHRENKPAQELYQKMGFQIVEKATPHLAAEQTYLLVFEA